MIHNGTCVLTGVVQVQAANLVTPKAYNGIGQPKFSLTIIFDEKSPTNTEIISAIEDALSQFFHSNVPSTKKLKMPYIKLPNGFVMLTARNTVQPKIVDENQKPLSPSQISAGDTVRVYIDFYAYSFSNNQGVACLLGDIQKLPPSSSNFSGIGITSHSPMPSTFPALTALDKDIDNVDDEIDDGLADEIDDGVTYIVGKNGN